MYLEFLANKSAENATGFLARLIKKAPFKASKVLTDNGKEFTDRFCATGEGEPIGNLLFDKVCRENEIEHRLIKPRKPQKNGMVERFNGRVAGILKTISFSSSEQIASVLRNYGRIYDQHIPQKKPGTRCAAFIIV